MITEYQLLNPFKQIWLKLNYFFTTLKEFYRYPYVLIGEELNDKNSKTILMYRLCGKSDIYRQNAEEICNDPELITKFHPLDVRVIAYICGIEQALAAPEEKRTERFVLIKNMVFKK